MLAFWGLWGGLWRANQPVSFYVSQHLETLVMEPPFHLTPSNPPKRLWGPSIWGGLTRHCSDRAQGFPSWCCSAHTLSSSALSLPLHPPPLLVSSRCTAERPSLFPLWQDSCSEGACQAATLANLQRSAWCWAAEVPLHDQGCLGAGSVIFSRNGYPSLSLDGVSCNSSYSITSWTFIYDSF